MAKPARPIRGQRDWFPIGHPNDAKHLAALRDERAVGGTFHLKRAPKAEPLDAFEPSFNDQPVGEPRGLLVVNLGPEHDWINIPLRHPRETHPELLREQGSGNLDEAQVRDIMHDPGAIGVEKHHLQFRRDSRSFQFTHTRWKVRSTLAGGERKSRRLARSKGGV